jgi:hypothetical protein
MLITADNPLVLVRTSLGGREWLSEYIKLGIGNFMALDWGTGRHTNFSGANEFCLGRGSVTVRTILSSVRDLGRKPGKGSDGGMVGMLKNALMGGWIFFA